MPNKIFAQHFISVVDSSERIPVSFAHVIAVDTSFQAYTNIEGKVELPKGVIDFTISCLGYETRNFSLDGFPTNVVFYLNKSSYTIQSLSITAQKLNLYKEVEKVRKKLKGDKSEKYVSTKTSFETIYKDNSIEKGELFCRDRLSVNSGFETTERLYSDYSFDPEKMFLNVDIDRLIKKVNLSEKRGVGHLFNQGKIKKNNVTLKIIKELDSLFVISYSREGQSGYIKFNKYNYRLKEYRILDYQVDNSIYTSINNEIPVVIDTLILNCKFKNGFVKSVSFYVCNNVQNIGEIKTSGFIEEVDFQNKKYSTNSQLSSIQYDAYISDFSNCKPENKPAKIFYDKIVKRKSLVKDDKLSVALLQEHGYAPKIKLWNTEQRLGVFDFKIFDQNIDFSRSKSQRSDFHTFQVDWVLFDDYCDAHKGFGNISSIWNSNKAVFVSRTKYHSLLLANLTLDVYEIYRRGLVEKLSVKKDSEDILVLIKEYHEKATEYVNQMNQETNFGNEISKVIEFNNFVKNKLGVDNIKNIE